MVRWLFLLLTASVLFSQGNKSWREPFPAHKIAGNLYYVGTADLACFLLTSPEGHILINTGLVDSTPLIREGMAKLGFRIQDIKILLTMQAHFDHVAAMKEIQDLSGAKFYATEGDAASIQDGGKSDPYPSPQNYFAPVKVDRKLKDGEVIKLGGTELKVISTPGHSRGSVSYSTTVMDNGVKRSVLIANMGTVVMPLVGNTNYPQIADDFARSFEKQKKLSADIFVAAHASQYGMVEKLKAGSFVDPQGYKSRVEDYEKKFRAQLEKERNSQPR